MTFNKMGRSAMASMVSLAMGLGMTACSRTYTVGYVYMTAAKPDPGLINGI
jgi:6-phosphogluconolactonase